MKLKHSLEWVLEGTASTQFGMGLGGDSFQRRRGEGGRNELGVQHFLFSAAEMIFVMLMRNFSGRCAILAERNQ